MRKIRWGVLGVAKIATDKVIPAMQRGQWSEVTAIASRDLEKARSAAAKLGIAKAYGSYEALLADAEIDAVYNPLPNHLHVPWTIQAAERGKHVLCEKPIALSADEARQLVAARDRTGVHIQEAFMVRTHPQWVAVKDTRGRRPHRRSAIDAGSLQLHQPRPGEHPQPPGVRRRRVDGHRLLPRQHVAVHLRARAGARRRRRRARPGHAHGPADLHPPRLRHGTRGRHLQHADGVRISSCKSSAPLGRIELPIPFNAPPDRPSRIIVDTGADLFGGGISHIDVEVCNQYTIQGDLFSKAILDNTNVPSPLEDAVKNMACIDALFKSAETGRWEVPQ